MVGLYIQIELQKGKSDRIPQKRSSGDPMRVVKKKRKKEALNQELITMDVCQVS